MSFGFKFWASVFIFVITYAFIQYLLKSSHSPNCPGTLRTYFMQEEQTCFKVSCGKNWLFIKSSDFDRFCMVPLLKASSDRLLWMSLCPDPRMSFMPQSPVQAAGRHWGHGLPSWQLIGTMLTQSAHCSPNTTALPRWPGITGFLATATHCI